MQTEKIPFLNTYYHNLSMSETLELIKNAIDNKNQIQHSVINAAKIVALQNDLELRKSVNSSDLINIDGQAVLWAAKFLNKPTKERVSGIDLMVNLVEIAYQNNYRIYLLGAKQNVVEAIANLYTKKYGKNLISGYRNGYFSKEQEVDIVNDITNSKADILFVAITSPKKENFLHKYKNELRNVGFIMGVGGSFDVIAGITKRAPIWMQKSGLEWFFRLIQEPERMWKRYLFGNLNFIKLILTNKLTINHLK
jgi:N-acetylglucosaminyldiphosphoundecaprenol N-acetyl-beta-D-mannosaminyltransferase